MKPDVDDIKERIAECCTLFGFEYHGIQCDIDPFNAELFELHCNGEQMTVHSIDEVMETPFFCGKSLSEIVDEIDIFAW